MSTGFHANAIQRKTGVSSHIQKDTKMYKDVRENTFYDVAVMING